MATQEDSIDISQLRAFALGLTEFDVRNPVNLDACHLGYASKLTPYTL